MMSGSKAPDFDAYGLLRATHFHFYAPLRSVLNMCHWHIAPWHLFIKRRNVLFIQSKVVVVQVFPLCPSNAFPESVSDVILGKSDQADLVDMFRFQSIHAVDDHGFANAKSSVIFSDTYMVQTASSSVMAAEDAAHYGSILPDGYHTGAGIPVDKTFHTFSGIIDAPDTEAVNGHPEGMQTVIIFYGHWFDRKLFAH